MAPKSTFEVPLPRQRPLAWSLRWPESIPRDASVHMKSGRERAYASDFWRLSSMSAAASELDGFCAGLFFWLEVPEQRLRRAPEERRAVRDGHLEISTARLFQGASISTEATVIRVYIGSWRFWGAC